VLASHVVGGGEHVTQWRSTQDEALIVGVGDHEREARVAAGDATEAQRWPGVGHVGGEPVRDGPVVDAWCDGHVGTSGSG
jgi:hypothetical protein